MTRNENGIPQITFVPSAVYQRFGVLAHELPEELVAEPDEEGRRHQREHEDVEGDHVALQRQRRRNAIDSENPNTRHEDARDDGEPERLAARRADVVRDAC